MADPTPQEPTAQEARRLYQCIMHDFHDNTDREEMWIKEIRLVIEAEATRRVEAIESKYYPIESALERAEAHGNGLDYFQVEELLEQLKQGGDKQ